MKANLVIVLPMVLLGCIASPVIIRLYGHGFAAGVPALILAFLTAGVLAAQAPVGDLIAASGQMWKGFYLNLMWALVLILSSHFLIHRGATGLAAARLIAYLVHVIGTVWIAVSVLSSRRREQPTEELADLSSELPRSGSMLE